MRAVVRDGYGGADVLRLDEVPDPVAAAGGVVVAVRAVSINQWDHHLLTGESWVRRGGFSSPLRVLGSDVAGQVVAVGPGVTRLRVGDDVVGELSSFGFGGLAELVAAPEEAFVAKPPGLSWVDAAAAPQAGTIASQGLAQARMRPGARVLVNGAGGGAGTYAVQLARAAGAGRLTVVDAAPKLPALRELGADEALDYRRVDWTRLTGPGFDVVVDFEAWLPVRRARRRLAPDGRYVTTGGSLGVLAAAAAAAPITTLLPGPRVAVLLWKPHRHNDIHTLLEQIAGGRIRSVVDSVHPLEATAAAFDRFAAGEFVGKVVITV